MSATSCPRPLVLGEGDLAEALLSGIGAQRAIVLIEPGDAPGVRARRDLLLAALLGARELVLLALASPAPTASQATLDRLAGGQR